jgi:hypothetical protein
VYWHLVDVFFDVFFDVLVNVGMEDVRLARFVARDGAPTCAAAMPACTRATGKERNKSRGNQGFHFTPP